MINTSIPKVAGPNNLGSGKPAKPSPLNKSNSPVAEKKPLTMSQALARYKATRRRVKYLNLKAEFLKLNSSEEALLKKLTARMLKLKKAAAPELIRINQMKKAARGRGKKRGSDLARFMSRAKV